MYMHTFDMLSSFKNQLATEVRSRIEMSEELAMATAMHPTYNNLWIIPDERFRSSVLAKLQEEYIALSPRPATPPPVEEHIVEPKNDNDEDGLRALLKRRRLQRDASFSSDKTVDEDEWTRYMQLEVDEVDPLEWWRMNKMSYPTVSKLARKYLGIPASSVASERLFSYSGGVVADKRSRLGDDAVSDIVFCHYASKCLAI